MEVIDSSTISATGEGLWLAQICKESIFDIDTHGNEDNLRVNILCKFSRYLILFSDIYMIK